MKQPAYILLLLLLACNSRPSSTEAPADTASGSKTAAEPGNAVMDSTALFSLSDTILSALKAKDYRLLASFVHPEKGLLLSPYAYIDTAAAQVLTAIQLQETPGKIKTWGYYDGSGDPIRLSMEQYFERFVYNADFKAAPQKAFNSFLGLGNSLNNLRDIYPGAVFTEFYFPGFEARYNGMDRVTLRLVFMPYQGRPRLVALVHDQWTV